MAQRASKGSKIDPCDRKALHQRRALAQISILSDDHVKYCLALKKQINPESKDFKLFYGASGTDLSVPLLTTNATEIVCLDNHGLDSRELGSLLMKGADSLYDTSKIPFKTSFF